MRHAPGSDAATPGSEDEAREVVIALQTFLEENNIADFSELPWNAAEPNPELWQQICCGGNMENFWIPKPFFAILKGKQWSGFKQTEYWHEGGKPNDWNKFSPLKVALAKVQEQLQELRQENQQIRRELGAYKKVTAGKTKKGKKGNPKPAATRLRESG